MILFFEGSTKNIIAVGTKENIQEKDIEKLIWLFGNAVLISRDKLKGTFIGPRKEMITPWSTNAVEITQNMGIRSIKRIEEFQVSHRESTSRSNAPDSLQRI